MARMRSADPPSHATSVTLPGAVRGARDHASPARVWAALAVVYVVWGSTYFAIRIAVRTMPALLMASARYLVAGVVLYAWASRRGDRHGDRPTRRQWAAALVLGGLLLLGGNGGVSWAEQHISSGLAALLVGAVPLWMGLIDRVGFRRRLGWRAIAGLVAGFAGLALLVGGSIGGRADAAGVGVVVAASVCWAAGSIFSRHAPLPARALVGTAMELVAGGVLLAIVGLATGEASRVHPDRISTASILALAYLIVFGTWLAFSAYAWLLRNAPTSLVSTYAYVNPVVAVLLGWAFLSERVTPTTLAAGGVIVAAVALIVSGRGTAGETPVPAEAAPVLEAAEHQED